MDQDPKSEVEVTVTRTQRQTVRVVLGRRGDRETQLRELQQDAFAEAARHPEAWSEPELSAIADWASEHPFG